METHIKDKLDKLINIIQTKFEEDYVNEFCQEIYCYILENSNESKKLNACQYLKETFITNVNNELNDVYDRLSWGLMPVLTACLQYTDDIVDESTKNVTNDLAVELLNNFLKTSSPKELIMVFTEAVSNLSEINSFIDVNDIENETLLFNQLYQYIVFCKALLNALTIIKTKNRHQFMKNVLSVLNKGLKSIELLSKRYNQYYFDVVNNESSPDGSLYNRKEEALLNELIDFNLFAMDQFVKMYQTEISNLPESERSINHINALIQPQSEVEKEYYLTCYYLLELCDYGLAYCFTGSPTDFRRLNPNKYRTIIGNYELKDYHLMKWYQKLMIMASDLSLDISKLFYFNNNEKYKELNQSEFYDEEKEEEEENKKSLSDEYPLSFTGRAVLLSSGYDLLLHPNPRLWMKSIEESTVGEEKEEMKEEGKEESLIPTPSTVIRQLFPKVLSHSYIFYSTFDYLNNLMTSKQDIGVVSHVVQAMEYMKSISGHPLITLQDLKDTNDIHSVNLQSLLKSYVSLMVMVPYAIMRDRMYLQLKEWLSHSLTEEARFSFIMEVIQGSYTESIVVLGIVLYKEAIQESWMNQVYGQEQSMNIQNKKGAQFLFSTECLDIVRKTLFRLESPLYESFNTDLTFLHDSSEDQSQSQTEDQKSKALDAQGMESTHEIAKRCRYLNTYEGFWKKFEILFQSLNLYSYLFLRDNKEKMLQIWNNSFNDRVEQEFLIPLKALLQKWQKYVMEKQKEQEGHGEHEHEHGHHHGQPATVNPYSFIPDCPEFQLMMMDNMIEQLFALKKDFMQSE